MIAVVQRVTRASVRFRETAAPSAWSQAGEIGAGLLVLLGVERADSSADVPWMARRIARLRVFPDHEGRMNREIAEIGGSILLVSQFTLCGDCSRGNRPSFIEAAPPEVAEPLVEQVAALLRHQHGLRVETGRFRTEMQVELINDGPVTLVLRSPRGPSAQGERQISE